MGKKIKVVLSIVVGILVLYIIGIVFFSNNIFFNSTVYKHKTDFSNTSLKTLLDNEKMILNVKDRRKTISISLNDLDYKIINVEDIKQNIIKKQNPYEWPIKMFQSSNYDVANIEVDQKKLETFINKEVIKNKGLVESKSAYFDLSNEDKVKVVKEVVGEQLDDNLVKDTINNSLTKGNIEINLKNAVIQPAISASELEKTIDEVDYKLNNTIKLVVEGNDFTINPTKKDILGWLNVDYKSNKVIVEKKAILNYLKNVNSKFIKDGENTETIYRVSNGVSTLVSQGKAVLGVDEYAVSALIYNAMKNNYSINEKIKAITISTPKVKYEGVESIDDNMLEVSIANQKVYIYNSGKLIHTASIVTGKPNGEMDTPKGKYTIMYKTTNFVLKGQDYGYDYKLPVDFWIPLNNGGGVGFHDAPWRKAGTFGGTNYINDGSHGCINMKLADVRVVYNNVVAGTGVWIH